MALGMIPSRDSATSKEATGPWFSAEAWAVGGLAGGGPSLYAKPSIEKVLPVIRSGSHPIRGGYREHIKVPAAAN